MAFDNFSNTCSTQQCCKKFSYGTYCKLCFFLTSSIYIQLVLKHLNSPCNTAYAYMLCLDDQPFCMDLNPVLPEQTALIISIMTTLSVVRKEKWVVSLLFIIK